MPMKKTMKYLFFILFICLTSRASTQCPPIDLIFSTQQQLFDFASRYPGCSEIPGNVTIGTHYGKTDIHDLSILNHVRTIGGYLNILNNPDLPDLSGLENLTSIAGFLNIYNNERLSNLHGLEQLSELKGSLWIIHNQNLSSISGLGNVSTIDGSLDIHVNPNLATLEGLENIDPHSIKTTLEYSLATMIDVRIDGNLDEKELPLLTSFISNRNAIYYFQKMSGKPYHEREIITEYMYRELEYMEDTTNAKQILDEISRIADSTNESQLQWEARLLSKYYQLYHSSEPMEARIDHMRKFADLAGREGFRIIQARAIKFIAFIYWEDFPDYEKLFQTYHQLERLITKLSDDEFPDMAQCYMIIGRAHFYFRNYENAIHYFRKATSISLIPFNTTFVMHSRNNLGLSFQNLNQLDSSEFYFLQILNDSTQYPVEIWKGIAAGNLGQ